MDTTRFLAWMGSALGNATLFGAILAGWPGLPTWEPVFSEPRGRTVIELGFRPFVYPIFDGYVNLRSGPDCPDPAVRESEVVLAHAPLPPAFDPFAYWDRPTFACIRIDAAGAVSSVALIGLEDPVTARALARTIRDEWRFSPGYDYRAEAGWVRVSLSAATASPTAEYFHPL